jgi:predicted dehydrogenase
LGKPVFAEKPMAAGLAEAEAMAQAAAACGVATAVDFNFSAVLAFRKAKELLEQGAIGRLRHVTVNWNVENASTRMRLKHWKTAGADGGGALGNFVSHSFHYLEWLCGSVTGLSARLSGLPEAPSLQTNAAISLRFASGAAGNLTMSSASYLGSGHRLEFYGEDGTLTLVNPTPDYMRGFELRLARRPATALARVEIDDPLDRLFPADGRIAPVARLASAFLDAIQQNQAGQPGFVEGLRVQTLLEAARRANNSRASFCSRAMPARDIAVFPTKIARAAGSGGSVSVECCQICGHEPLSTVLSLGYMPPVNQMVAIGEVQKQQPWFPTNLMHCPTCELVQLGLAVDPVIIFPPEYPYTSGMTRILCDNFAEDTPSPRRCLGSPATTLSSTSAPMTVR